MKERNTAQTNQFVSSMAVIVVDPLKIAYLGKACSNKTVWHSYFTLGESMLYHSASEHSKT